MAGEVGQNPQALLWGTNVRISVKGVLAAAWRSTVLFLKVKKVLVLGLNDPIEAFDLGDSAFGAATAVLDACRQRLSPLAYFAALILSKESNGLVRSDLPSAVRSLAEDVERGDADLPWYLFVTRKRARIALEALQKDSTAARAITELQVNDLATSDGDRITFHPLNIEWKF
jgi:hypothetical protein